MTLEHEGLVRIVTFSPDGKLIASGGRSVRVWNAETGELLATLGERRYRDEPGDALTFSPDGKHLVFHSRSESEGRRVDVVAVVEVRTGKQVAEVRRFFGFSPDGTRFIAEKGRFEENKTVAVWDAETGELRTTLATLESGGGVVLSPDAGRIATVGDLDGPPFRQMVTVRDVETAAVVNRLPAYDYTVWPLAMDEGGGRLAVKGPGTPVDVWDVDRGERVATLPHRESIESPRFTARLL